MISLLFIFFAAAITYYYVLVTERDEVPVSLKISKKLERLWQVAQTGMSEKRYLRAEKALLTILKLDQKNVAAYNRLGILYSRQKEYKDAIECFEIASSIEPSASSLHNLGLIYYETENYPKAALAFESALKIEDGLAARYIAYAKVQEKLENNEGMLSSLKKAVDLEPNPQSYKMYGDALAANGFTDEARKILAKKEKLILPSTKSKRIQRPRRVIY